MMIFFPVYLFIVIAFLLTFPQETDDNRLNVFGGGLACWRIENDQKLNHFGRKSFNFNFRVQKIRFNEFVT